MSLLWSELVFLTLQFLGEGNLKKLFTGWMANQSVVSRLSASAGPIYLVARNNADSEHVSKRPRPFGPSDEVNTLPVNIMPISYSSQNHGQSSYTSDDLPKNPVMALNQGSAVKSMNFHPVQKILFPFPGVAYSRHVVHVYSYHGGADIRNHLEFIFSTATDGKIKAWLYDNAGSRVDYDAPGRSSATMAYSADGTSCRVFLCGTNKEGESHLVEWNESEGAVKRFFLVLDFNKEGSLLVVSTKDNGIKILANSDGIRLLRTVESRAFDDPRAAAVKINSSTICLVRYLVLTQWGYASKTFCYSIWSEA
ncbi:hypothetical protein OIU77_005653 [Salix suchowensis]|uniref:Uncharacterized protein n=1 Tax=Salix suchowensis TaxID=1278906 RepID=A0ABQ9AQ53_9ROSI|nr:hypothetical protein OIU77_005653 [Salix suchowensis]